MTSINRYVGSAEHPFKVSLEVYTQFLDTIPDAALLVAENGKIVYANPQAELLFGYAPLELNEQTLNVLIPTEARPKHHYHLQNFVAAPKTRAMGSGAALHGLRKTGEVFPVDIMLKPLEIDSTAYILSIIRDTSEIKRYESELKKFAEREATLARTDHLTGIANARQFYSVLQNELDRLRRYGTPFTLAYIDLDNFKTVNDQQGHSAGDEVLRCVANLLSDNIRKTDCIARLGGDEFVMLLLETSPSSAQTSVSKIQANLLEEMRARNWGVTFSIGIITCIDAPNSIQDVIKLADELMYQAKQQGKDAICSAIYTA